MRHIILLFTLTAAAASLSACGGDSRPAGGRPGTAPGSWMAELKPLNDGEGVGPVTGTARITVAGDQLTATVEVAGSEPGTTHLQHVRLGPDCPTSSADANDDGWVDVKEGTNAYGESILPLDGDLASQAGGGADFPVANSSGEYAFNRSASLSALQADLNAADPDPNDGVAKMGGALSLEGRSVVIHGVPADVEMPDTVATLPGSTPQATLPVACGVLRSVQPSPSPSPSPSASPSPSPSASPSPSPRR
jgi:Cu/Zn superoxide dismutase